MNKSDSGGFSVVEVLIILVVVILIGGAGFYVYRANNSENSDSSKKNQDSAQTDASADNTSVPNGYTEYKNTQYKFSFVYPEDWTQQSAEEAAGWGTGAVVSLISPKTAEDLEYNIDQGILGSPSATLVVSRWDSIKEPSAMGGEWTGQREYASLEDYLNDSDEQRPKQKTDELSIAGQKAYEVTIGGYGSDYGIMLERAGAVYEFRFIGTDNITEEDKRIFQSFKFY